MARSTTTIELNATVREGVQQELEVIRAQNNGSIPPRKTWQWAKRHPKSVLHSQFDWDVQSAAESWWDHQARKIITMCVEVVELDDGESVSHSRYCSLSMDRRSGAGYRRTSEVLRDPELRAIYLRDALADAENYRKRYVRIRDLLAPIYDGIDAVMHEHDGGVDRKKKVTRKKTTKKGGGTRKRKR